MNDQIESDQAGRVFDQQKKRTSLIHPTAIIDPQASLDSSVEVGPYSVIGKGVSIGPDTVIGPHVVLKGELQLGAQNRVFQFASVGEDCQDKKYQGEPTVLIIGDRNVIRECATLQRGTAQEEGITRIGNGNLFMAYTHVGHDCNVGNNCVFANSATIAGHVNVGDGVILGGFTGVHQFCQIGDYAMTGMCSAVNMDVPAFVRVQGNMAQAQGLNIEGMRRRHMSKNCIALLQKAYKIVYRENLKLDEALKQLKNIATSLEVEQEKIELERFTNSILTSKRGITR